MWTRNNWSCGRSARCLGEYLDGTLPLRRRRTLEHHLRTCVACRGELATMRQTLALLSDLPRREVSDNFEDALRARLSGIQAGGALPARGRFSFPARLQAPARYLRAPWPSEVRRLAPVGALAAVALGLTAWNMQPAPSVTAERHSASAYVKWASREHEMLSTGVDMNSTVVSHNLGSDPLGDGDEE